MNNKLVLLAIPFVGALLAAIAQAGSTILEFDDLPGPTNDPIPAFFGSNASANTSGTTVTSGGTPDIVLFWTGSGSAWDQHDSSAWNALDSPGNVHVAQLDWELDLSITFTPANASTVFHLDGFDLGNASDQSEPAYGWDISLRNVDTSVVAATLNTPDLGPGETTSVVANFTGIPGARYRMEFVPNENADFVNNTVFRTAIDGLAFSQSTVVLDDADFDSDSDIDGADFLTWQDGLGLMGQTDNSNGDANGDGTVGASDLVVWNSQYGGAATLAAVSAIPEPTTMTLVWLCLAGVCCKRGCGVS